MANKWIQLNQLGGNGWVLGIWTAINDAEKAGKCGAKSQAMQELGEHISIRLTLLPWLVRSFSDNLQSLYKELERVEEKHIFKAGKEGDAFDVNEDLKYSLIAQAQSVLFEINACAENFEAFYEYCLDFPRFCRHMIVTIESTGGSHVQTPLHT